MAREVCRYQSACSGHSKLCNSRLLDRASWDQKPFICLDWKCRLPVLPCFKPANAGNACELKGGYPHLPQGKDAGISLPGVLRLRQMLPVTVNGNIAVSKTALQPGAAGSDHY